MIKHLSRCAALLLVATLAAIGPTAPAQADITPTCVTPDGVSAQHHCGAPTVMAQLSTWGNGEYVRIWGYVYYPKHGNLSISVTLDIGGVIVFSDRQPCGSYSDTCTYDKSSPCFSRCVDPGWYWLTVQAWSGSRNIGAAQDRLYINCPG